MSTIPLAPSLAELTPAQLSELYFRFVAYRDRKCGGMAKMSVAEFHANTWKA